MPNNKFYAKELCAKKILSFFLQRIRQELLFNIQCIKSQSTKNQLANIPFSLRHNLKVINTYLCGIYINYGDLLSSLSRTILNLNFHKYLNVCILSLVNSNRRWPIKFLKSVNEVNCAAPAQASVREPEQGWQRMEEW